MKPAMAAQVFVAGHLWSSRLRRWLVSGDFDEM